MDATPLVYGDIVDLLSSHCLLYLDGPSNCEGEGEVKQVLHLLLLLQILCFCLLILHCLYYLHKFLFLVGEGEREDVNGGGCVPNQEDDDGGDDEDKQEDGDTKRLLLVGGLQLALHCHSAHHRLPVRFSSLPSKLTQVSSSVL